MHTPAALWTKKIKYLILLWLLVPFIIPQMHKISYWDGCFFSPYFGLCHISTFNYQITIKVFWLGLGGQHHLICVCGHGGHLHPWPQIYCSINSFILAVPVIQFFSPSFPVYAPLIEPHEDTFLAHNSDTKHVAPKPSHAHVPPRSALSDVEVSCTLYSLVGSDEAQIRSLWLKGTLCLSWSFRVPFRFADAFSFCPIGRENISTQRTQLFGHHHLSSYPSS